MISSAGTWTSSIQHGRPRPPSTGSARSHIKLHLDGFSGILADLAQRLRTHLNRLTEEIDELTAELSRRFPAIAPALLAIVGCGSSTAAKILERPPALRRFRSKDAYARHNGSAPLKDGPQKGPAPTLPNREQTAERGAAPDRTDPGPLPPRRAGTSGPP